jgi:uncharacterized membrane protein
MPTKQQLPAEPPDIIETDLPPPGLGGRVRNYFLTGLVVAGPLAITAWLIWSFVTWVDDLVRPFIPDIYRPETYLPWKIPGSGLVIAFIALTMLGFLTANIVGRTLLHLSESALDRMPIVRPIYKTVKQVFTMLFSKSGTSFRKVGLIQFPAPGMWSLVFISQPPSTSIAARLPDGEEQISVFMPCTPNPTTGFFFYLPRREIIELDIPVEAAATLIMSAGMVQPGTEPAKGLAALAATARAAQEAQNGQHARNHAHDAPKLAKTARRTREKESVK